MSSSFAFTPIGPTVLVAASAVSIGPTSSNCYRVRNLSASVQYFTHGATGAVASITPSAGSPAANTVGMLPQSVEVFGNLLPFMIASSASGFEVTAGDGV